MREVSIALLLLLVGMGRRGLAEEVGEGREPAAAEESLGVRDVTAGSGPCPGLTEMEAREEATAKAERNMVDALQALAQELAGISLPSRRAWLEWAWLLRQPDVRQQVKRSCEAKAYGPVATQEIRLSLPRDVLTAWTARLKRDTMLAWQARLFGGIGTTLLTLAALLAILILDRRSGGYHRGLVIASVLIVVGLLLAALWVWLLWAF